VASTGTMSRRTVDKAANPFPIADPIAAGKVVPSAGALVDVTVAEVADVVALEPNSDIEVPDRDVPAATAREEAPSDAKLAAGTGAPGERGTPSIVTPLPELCREACANAHRLVLAELSADTAKAMREEVQRALERECPGRCMQRASLDSARCIATAKSALELAACQ